MLKNVFNIIFLYTSILSLIILEVFCGKLAFETLGEVVSISYFYLIALNIAPLVLLLLNKQKQFAMGLIMLIGLVIVPYQLNLWNKLISLKEEAANITAYAYEQKLSNDTYPKDLSGYVFSFPKLKKHFNYIQNSADNFQLFYYVGKESTSHYYKSDTKKWDYYPD